MIGSSNIGIVSAIIMVFPISVMPIIPSYPSHSLFLDGMQTPIVYVIIMGFTIFLRIPLAGETSKEFAPPMLDLHVDLGRRSH